MSLAAAAGLAVARPAVSQALAAETSLEISGRISRQLEDLTQARRELAQVEQTISDQSLIIQRNRIQLADVSSLLSQAEHRHNDSLLLFSERLAAIYKLGDSNVYELILTSDNLAEAMTRLHYLGVISRSDLKVIERLKEEEAEVRRLHSRMDILKQESFQDIGELRQRQAGLKMQVASVSAQLERDNAALEKAWAREAEEEARRAAEESLRLDQDFNLLVGAPAIVAGSIPPPSGLRPSAIVLSGIASWYGPGFHGNRTANGEIYNMNAMTAAHKSLPFGTWLKVTYEDRSVFVRINDRGPYIDGRFLDLSAGSARAIGLTGIGHVKAEIYH